MKTLTTIAARRSYRGRYLPTAVPREHLKQILEAGYHAPSGCNQQTTSFIAVDDPELMAKAQEIRTLSNQKGSSDPDVKSLVALYGFTNVYEATGLVSRISYPESYTMELHYMDIQGVSFIFAPFEMFAATGSYVKENSPIDMTFICSCSNDAKSYIPTADAYDYGCYESYTSYFAKGTAELLQVKYVELLESLK